MMYDDFYKTKFGKFSLEREAEYIAKEVKGTVLSIGCGTGVIENMAEKIGKIKIIGIEKDDEMLEIARKRIVAIKGDAAWLPFANEKFDAIIFITSLEFIEDYKKAIEEAYRVLKKDGKFIALLLNTDSKYFKERQKKKGYISKNLRHRNIKKIEEEAEKYFEIVHEYFLCMNMKEECKNDEKALYAIRGRKK